mgnify:CR=1 FL=1
MDMEPQLAADTLKKVRSSAGVSELTPRYQSSSMSRASMVRPVFSIACPPFRPGTVTETGASVTINGETHQVTLTRKDCQVSFSLPNLWAANASGALIACCERAAIWLAVGFFQRAGPGRAAIGEGGALIAYNAPVIDGDLQLT